MAIQTSAGTTGAAAALPGTFYRAAFDLVNQADAAAPLHGPCAAQHPPQADVATLAMDLLHDTISGTASMAEARAACSALRDGDLTGALDGLNTSIRVVSEPPKAYLSGRQVRERQRLLNVAQIARVLVLDAIAAALRIAGSAGVLHKNVLALVIELMHDLITGTLSIHEAHAGLISGDASGALDYAYRALRDGDLTGAMKCLNAAIQIASLPPKEGATGRSQYRQRSHLHERQRLLNVAQIARVLVRDVITMSAGDQLPFARLLRFGPPRTMAALTARTSWNGFERWRQSLPLDRNHAIEHHCSNTGRPVTGRHHKSARAADPAGRSDQYHWPAQDKHLRGNECRGISEKHQDLFTRQRLAPVGRESLGFFPCRKRGGWQMRLSIKCAHCGSRSTVMRMIEITNNLVELGYRCTNVECGHHFVVAAQTIRTTVLPAVLNPAVKIPLSSRIDRQAIERAMATLPTASERVDRRNSDAVAGVARGMDSGEQTGERNRRGRPRLLREEHVMAMKEMLADLQDRRSKRSRRCWPSAVGSRYAS